MDTFDVAHFVSSATISCVSIPIIGHLSLRLYQQKNNPIVSHRNVKFVLVVNTTIIITIFVNQFIDILKILNIISSYPHWVDPIFSALLIYGVVDMLCIKSYLLFFQQKYHSSMNELSSSTKKINDNFFIRNKSKWGNLFYLFKWIIMPYIIIITLEIIGESYLHQYHTGKIIIPLVRTILILIPFILLLLFMYNLRTFQDDIYGIRKEIVVQSIFFIISGAIYGIVVIVFSLNKFNLNPNKLNNIERIHSGISTAIIFTAVAISSTYYPLYLIQNLVTKEIDNINGLRILSGFINGSNINNNNNNNSPKISNKPRRKFITIKTMMNSFKDSKIFSLFMKHLVSEFATENLFFITELIQIKNAYQESQHNVIKVTNRNNTDLVHNILSPLPSNSMVNLKQIETEENMNNTESKYLVLDFNNNINDGSSDDYDNESQLSCSRSPSPSPMPMDMISSIGSPSIQNIGEIFNEFPIFNKTLKSLSPKSESGSNIVAISIPNIPIPIPSSIAISTPTAESDRTPIMAPLPSPISLMHYFTNPSKDEMSLEFESIFNETKINNSKEKEDNNNGDDGDDKLIVTYLFGYQFVNDIINISIPNDLPKSVILANNKNNIFKQIISLYHKYIETNSDCEINLPYLMRKNVSDKINNLKSQEIDSDYELNEGDLFWIYDECCLHILNLLITSFRRCTNTDKYKEYINQNSKQNNEYDPTRNNNNTIVVKPLIYSGKVHKEILQKYAISV